MTNEAICERLNPILANELAGAMMYLHYSFFIYGHARIPIVGWLRSQSSEGMTHATLVGDKITALGGIPVTHPTHGKFPTSFDSLDEMLRATLVLEKEVFEQYATLLRDLDDENLAMRVYLEQMLTEEIGHIEEIEKMLRPDTVH
ncbi:MAG: ferritin-like domain-containing protein [Candidatus Kapaibacterium sp.]